VFLWEWRTALGLRYPCPRKLKQELTPHEWETLKALSRREPLLDDRRDEGIVRLAVAIVSALGAKVDERFVAALRPIQPPASEQTDEEMFNLLGQFTNGGSRSSRGDAEVPRGGHH
jgi:hypothetical protein